LICLMFKFKFFNPERSVGLKNSNLNQKSKKHNKTQIRDNDIKRLLIENLFNSIFLKKCDFFMKIREI